jgi:HrpA-like RNA helicase
VIAGEAVLSHPTMWEDEELSPLGSHLAALPVEPPIGKMLVLGAVFQCLEPMLVIAAALGSRSPFSIPLHAREAGNAARRGFDSMSDHLVRCSSLASSQVPPSNQQVGSTALVWCSSLASSQAPPSNQQAGSTALVWCAFFDRNLHSRMPLVPTPACLKLLHACDQWHSSRVVAHLPIDNNFSSWNLKHKVGQHFLVAHLPFDAVNSVQTLKVSRSARTNHELCHIPLNGLKAILKAYRGWIRARAPIATDAWCPEFTVDSAALGLASSAWESGSVVCC